VTSFAFFILPGAVVGGEGWWGWWGWWFCVGWYSLDDDYIVQQKYNDELSMSFAPI
jgi:hypothetical protein